MPFPNSSAVAYFEPNSQLIFLKHINAEMLGANLKGPMTGVIRRDLSTVYHEVTHWADTVGTLWGNEYLKRVYAAYDVAEVVNTPGAEADFFRFIDLHDEMRRLSYSDYYRLVEKDGREHSLSEPWRIEFSCGIEFNSSGRPDNKSPIIFVRFKDHYSDRVLVRQPLSIAALLETTATWSELLTQLGVLVAMPDDERLVESYIMSKDHGKRLYDTNLSLYTAPVHLLAHYARIADPIVAYRLGAMLSLVCLNLVGSHFRKLKVPIDMHAWKDRFQAFLNAMHRPFAYKCICGNAPVWNDKQKPLDWVNEALLRSGLPSYGEILAHAVSVINEDTALCHRPEMSRRQGYLRELGRDWLDWRREKGDAGISLDHLENPNLVTPCVFDSDDQPFRMFGSAFDMNIFNPMDMYDEDASLHTKSLNFRTSCR